jgi:putative peptide zinc metalloprotease protein
VREHRAQRPVLARARGLELLGPVDGSGYREGAFLARREDGQMVHLGPLLYGLLECVDGRRDLDALAAALSERLGKGCEREHVLALGEKLAAQGLLAGHEHRAPARSNPLLGLRLKKVVTDPEVTDRITRPFLFLFRPWAMAPVLAAFAAVLWFVLLEKGVASATAQAFGNPELLLLVFGLAIFSAAFHEIGHATACRFGGARPGGMGAGIYMVWPAFYTDVTDAYRLPRRDRLRVDLGGLFFNAIVAVAVLGVWLALRVDALLLLVAVQLFQMVQQLSPVIRADGYHILSDATGVPDLYSHIGPTMRRLLPWNRSEPSALHGRARFIVTAWILIVFPLLLAMAASALLLFPRLVATAYESGRQIAGDIPDGSVAEGALGVLRLLALVLPVLGVALLAQRLLRGLARRAGAWSAGRPPRRAALIAGTVAAITLVTWAWWPSGQYRAIAASDNGTVTGLVSSVAEPQTALRPATPGPAANTSPPVQLAPGKHLAVALIPEGGPTEEHPAIYVIDGPDGEPATVVASDTAPAAAPEASTATAPATEEAAPAAEAVSAAAFPFELPSKPGPGDNQALAVNTQDGGLVYTVAYAMLTVRDGDPVTNANSAFAFASCKACTTVAVAFQVVLIVGHTDVIAPINVAGALNQDCPACITTAIADQIVATLESEPSEELLTRIRESLAQLDAIDPNAPAEDIATQVLAVHQQIKQALAESGQLASDEEAPPPAATTESPPPATTTPAETTAEAPPTETTEAEPTTTTPTETTSTTPTETTATTPTQTTATTETTPTTTTAEPAPAEEETVAP